MSISNRIQTFVKLGNFLKEITDNQSDNEIVFSEKKSSEQEEFRTIIQKAYRQNAWFTPENIDFAFRQWAKVLTYDHLNRWLSEYIFENKKSRKIALILAGNIPLVGFHDVVSVLLAGHTALIKCSSNDTLLIPFLMKKLIEINPSMAENIIFTDQKITDYDAVIATGSNNTARYFEYYFGKKPHIIRKNRNSVAVLTGNETQNELFELGKDIFTYFGLGCRSVSKIFVPNGYDFDAFFNAIYPYHTIVEHTKYANNYDYNKAVYLMSLFVIKENGFLMIKEDTAYSSPIATLFYEYYSDLNSLSQKLKTDQKQIQCIVSNGFTSDEIPFGQTQTPTLWQYADGIDTIDFLNNL